MGSAPGGPASRARGDDERENMVKDLGKQAGGKGKPRPRRRAPRKPRTEGGDVNPPVQPTIDDESRYPRHHGIYRLGQQP
jgi:hypothetical protein